MGRKKIGVVGRTYTITFEQAMFVTKYADAKGCPESHVVRMALQNELQKHKNTWDCLVCGAQNDTRFTKCWQCEHEKGTQKAK